MRIKSLILHLTLFFSVFLSLFWANAQSLPAPACQGVLGAEGPNLDYDQAVARPYFRNLTEAIPRVPEVMWKKYWQSAETLEIKRRLLLNKEGQSQMYSIEGEGEFITRTTVIDNYLFLDLIHIRARDQANSGIKIGERSRSINFLLVKAMTGFLQAATTIIEANPQIDRVVIKGVNLKNPMLMEFLGENGFALKRRGFTTKDYEKEIVLKAE